MPYKDKNAQRAYPREWMRKRRSEWFNKHESLKRQFMSLYTGDSNLNWRPLNELLGSECAECHRELSTFPVKIVYDFPQDQRTLQLCPGCARLVACRILLDVMRLEKGDSEVNKFWAERKKSTYTKANAVSNWSNWSEDVEVVSRAG
jgi:hypothetical protein